MNPIKCIGSCVPLFFMAVLFDVAGVILIFVGIFANVRLDGRFYGDFLIYTGSLIVFTSSAFWLMWYIGNVRVSVDDGLQKSNSIVELARKLSERLSQKLRGEERVKCVEDEDGSQVGSPKAKANRVTWGKSTAYHNEGYDDSMDYPGVEEKGSWTTFFLSIALIMDIVGLILFFIGIFAPLSFWDFFVLSGPLLIFLSLVLWIFWYMAHLTVSEEELNLPKHDML